MAFITLAEARQLSHCDVRPTTVSGFAADPFLTSVFPQRPVFGDCMRSPQVRMGTDMTTAGLFVGSGTAASEAPASIGVSREHSLARVNVVAEIDASLASGWGVHDLLADQIQAQTQRIFQAISEAIWSASTVANAFPSLAGLAANNPAGVRTPALGVGTPPQWSDLRCLRQYVRSTPSTPLYYACNRKTYEYLLAQAYENSISLAFRHHDKLGGDVLFFEGVPVVVVDTLSATETGNTSSVYLFQAGRDQNLPEKAGEGVVLLFPADMGGLRVRVGPTEWTSGSTELVRASLSVGVGLAVDRDDAVVRMQGALV
jgi:hypothetical protein